ncbi:D-2-hydroxyacid dehydrogenase [Natronomonas salina]|uniref:D-2-hydroxyacid dehydrogenase n=1 Tax=Natronomonas salina TaxID=1710540 RepID=UPI0015B6DD52|nr:D-2-hydroxyacid dehydrogenase [Natronomonas salina]QLD91020.1 D-2-hydroxyacid dehydrogenase [Natronomonas salina]
MELLVLREGVHRLSAAAYADELRSRLDGHTVRHARTPAEERRLVADAAVVTGPRIDADLLERADDLDLFACAYAGYGHLPLDHLEAAGVAVTNAAGVHAPNASEHAVGAILTFSRRFHEVARAETWQPVDPGELAGSTVTVVGLGAIGSAVVDRLEPFDVTTLGVRRRPEKGGPVDEVFGQDDLHEALSRTDFLVLCCPLTEETRGLIGESELTTLPQGAVLVNIARGEVVETDALVRSLRSGRLGGAALDVTDPEPLPDDHPLWNLDDVLVTPHSAGATPKYYERLADVVADNVGRLVEDRPLRNQVRPGEND